MKHTNGHAISLASSGDSIIAAAAIYKENLTIGKSVTIVGSGASTALVIAFADTFVLRMAARARAARSRINGWVF